MAGKLWRGKYSGVTSLNGARLLNSNGAPTKYKNLTVTSNLL